MFKHNGFPLHCITPIAQSTNDPALSANTEVAVLWVKKLVGEPKMLSYPFPVEGVPQLVVAENVVSS